MRLGLHHREHKETNLCKHLKHPSKKHGFTLLEVILAIAIMAMLISSVFTISNSSVLLSQSILEQQKHTRHQEALESYFENLFMNLPSNAKITLEENDTPSQTLVIENPSTFYPHYQNDHYAVLLKSSTEKNRNGLLDLRNTWQSILDNDLGDTSDPHSLVFIKDLISFHWEIYSASQDTWYPTWTIDQQRPSHIRLSYKSPLDQEQKIRTFWIPPKAQ